MEGVASALFDAGTGNLSRTAQTIQNQNFTLGCWARTTITSTRDIMYMDIGSNGWEMQRNTTTPNWIFRLFHSTAGSLTATATPHHQCARGGRRSQP